MKKEYEAILHHPHPRSQTHPPMPMRDRAAQFSPFAALTGYEEAVREAARLTEEKQTPDESVWDEMGRTLALLAEQLGERPEVELCYFLPDDRKQGGRYVTRRDVLVQVDTCGNSLTLADGTCVPFGDLLELRVCEKIV